MFSLDHRSQHIPAPQVDRASRMIEDIVSRSEEEPSPGAWKIWKRAEGPWPGISMGFIWDL